METDIQILAALQDIAMNRRKDPDKATEIEAMFKPYLSMFGYAY